MKRALPVLVVVVLAGVALAGSPVETNCGPPSSTAQMSSLLNTSSCRALAYFTDGGAITGGTFITHYYDPVLGMIYEGPKAEQCTLDTDAQADGGSRRSQACTWTVTQGAASYAGVSLSGVGGQNPICRFVCGVPP